ncbi:hypothetical protein K7432_011848 [Basidiobolus ranarum]|uniref:Yeast cell wall synthesis Kre9/Knh1-like N-terminal domain-containing protein n=1 Tax=Basidiobolus ranarum TaxID=34480 RepID=A0ABR2VT69_9FUNG
MKSNNKRAFFSQLVIILISWCCVNGDLAITTPVEGTRWRTGEPASVHWYEVPNTKRSKGPINIGLTSGPTHNLVLVAPIAVEIDPALGVYTWTVPHDILPGSRYSVRIGVAPGWSYSHYFTIEKGSPAPSTPYQNYPDAPPIPPQIPVQTYPEPAPYSPPIYEAPAPPPPPPPTEQSREEFADQEDQPEHFVDPGDPPITLDMEEAYGEDYDAMLGG